MCFFSLIYCLRVYFIWFTFVLWICHIQSTSFEILFWLKPYFKLIKYKYQQGDWVERDGEQYVLRMTHSAHLPPQRQLILSSTHHTGKNGVPPKTNTWLMKTRVLPLTSLIFSIAHLSTEWSKYMWCVAVWLTLTIAYKLSVSHN